MPDVYKLTLGQFKQNPIVQLIYLVIHKIMQ